MFDIAITVEVPAAIRADTNAFDGMLAEIGAIAQQQVAERFSGGHGPGGDAWAPTKRGGQILVDTGALMGSISTATGGDMVEIGTNVFYGAFHQSGTSKMVARPFLGFGADDWRQIEDVVKSYLDGIFGGGG